MSVHNSPTERRSLVMIPEIVTRILGWIDQNCTWWYVKTPDETPVERNEGNEREQRGSGLVECRLVNETWFHQAMRYLWRVHDSKNTHKGSLAEVLVMVHPLRSTVLCEFLGTGSDTHHLSERACSLR
jgi:hypothetical protein